MRTASSSSAACGRCATPLESGDIRCAICSLPRPRAATATNAVAAEVLRCDGCGAAVEYDLRVQAPKCAFCGSLAHVERSHDPIEAAERFVPFRVAQPAAHQSLKAWLGTLGFFRPSDLASASTLERLTPLWFVGWSVDCEALVSWTADTNAGRGRSKWAPHAGQFPVKLRSLLVSASRGLSAGEVARLAPGFDLSSAQPAPHDMAGAVIERFDVQRSSARAVVSQGIEATAAAMAKPHLPGSASRKLKVAPLLRSFETTRFALPAWVLAYRYRGKVYRAVVHGQDARIVFGDAPRSYWKMLGVVAAVLGVVGVAFACLFTAAFIGNL